MFMEIAGGHGPGGEPWEPKCHGCKLLIDDAHETVKIEFDQSGRLGKLNGTYHAECASPLLKLKRAHDMLGRFPG